MSPNSAGDIAVLVPFVPNITVVSDEVLSRLNIQTSAVVGSMFSPGSVIDK